MSRFEMPDAHRVLWQGGLPMAATDEVWIFDVRTRRRNPRARETRVVGPVFLTGDLPFPLPDAHRTAWQGKVRELLRWAEHRSPGGRFRVVLDVEDRTPVLEVWRLD